MRLLPAIDLKDGRCVRLLRGDFAQETAYSTAPLELARKFAAMGADWLHVVDLDGAREGRANRGNGVLIAQLARESGLRLQVGGGLRTRADVQHVLEAGAARAVIGSAALSDPAAVRGWMDHFGDERIALAFDVRLDAGNTPRIVTHGWQRQSTRALWKALADFPAGAPTHVLCTDVARDGALSGPNVALYAQAARRFPRIAWQASGGIRDATDLKALASSGAAAAISGKALLEDLIPIEELRPFLPNA
jgi:phosphoribosylformimino-5-aminoimidazole carboxamide ribotide isomerase